MTPEARQKIVDSVGVGLGSEFAYVGLRALCKCHDDRPYSVVDRGSSKDSWEWSHRLYAPWAPCPMVAHRCGALMGRVVSVNEKCGRVTVGLRAHLGAWRLI